MGAGGQSIAVISVVVNGTFTHGNIDTVHFAKFHKLAVVKDEFEKKSSAFF